MGQGGSDAALAGFAGKLGPNGKPIVLPGAADGSAAIAGKSAKAVANAKPDLQVIPGGLSSAGGEPLVGGLKLSKEEPKLTNTDSFMGAAPLSQVHRNADATVGIPPQVITGHVVPGTMQRDRLTSESVRNMANSISGLTPNGGGEMRIKMNPGNLGELMIRVSTNGKDVGLKVEATDSSAKKIIEESLGALRDSLAGQSLALGRVDVSIATKDTATTDNGSNSQNSSQSQGGAAFDTQAGMQNRSNGRSYTGEENSGSGVDRSSARVASSRIASLAAAAGSNPRTASGASRLDVMA
jgi:flagellar hook-length control protein FliK